MPPALQDGDEHSGLGASVGSIGQRRCSQSSSASVLVLVGAVASVVVWGIYGPLASVDLLTGEMAGVRLTVAQLLTSLVIGLSGGKILTLMAEKQAATISKDQLAAAVKALTEG